MFIIDKRYLKQFDWISFGIMIALMAIGVFFVFSATYSPERPFSIFFKKQTVGIVSGLILYFLCAFVNYKTLLRWGYFAYFFVIGLLIFTIIKGKIGMGAQRWIDLFIFRLQPSELAKLLFPSCVTYFLYTQQDNFKYTFKDFLPLFALLAVSCILILKQPDLGTALILFFSGAILFWLAGLDKRFFTYGLLLFFITAPISWRYLKPYQKRRVLVFLGHGQSHKERYQIEQSKIAVGSGGIIGKGFLHGTQNKLSFLPESRTDFIYSVISEEFGLIGSLIILFLFVALSLRFFFIIASINAPLIQLLATGLTIHIVLSAYINIAMVLDLLPIVGIPLPLLSYGISNLWITCISLGWFQGIAMRRRYITD